MPYTPPAWNAVDISFSLTFTPYRWNDVRFEFSAQNELEQHAAPAGIGPGNPSAYTVSWRQYLEPTGFLSLALGSARVYKGYRFDFLFSYSPLAWNAVSFSFADTVVVGGIGAGGLGSPALSKLDVVRPSGIAAGGIGESRVSLLVSPSGVAHGEVGAPSISLLSAILPGGIGCGLFGDPSVTSESTRRVGGGFSRSRSWPEIVVVDNVLDDEEEEVLSLVVSLAASGAFDRAAYRN